MAEITDAGHAIREERRPVTALFAGLVGSTALAERLEDAELRLVVGDANSARAEPDGRRRLELFALIPIAYGRDAHVVKPWVTGWWEYGKSWSSFADLVVDEPG